MSFPRFLTRIHSRYINKLALRFVGRTAVADLEHVGRRTGRPRIVPIGQGTRSIPKLFGFGLRYLVRTRDCLELSVLATVPASAAHGRPDGPGSDGAEGGLR